MFTYMFTYMSFIFKMRYFICILFQFTNTTGLIQIVLQVYINFEDFRRNLIHICFSFSINCMLKIKVSQLLDLRCLFSLGIESRFLQSSYWQNQTNLRRLCFGILDQRFKLQRSEIVSPKSIANYFRK